MSEEWLDGGNCTKCRKQKYCSHECTAHKNMVAEERTNFMSALMIKAGIPSEMVGYANKWMKEMI